MTIDDGPITTTVVTRFLVIKVDFAYNGIIGQTSLHTMEVVVLTYHQLVKFPTRYGIGHVQSDQLELVI